MKTTSGIDHMVIGELTGSIAGNVYCYGVAVHQEVLIYLNMAGPKMAVEAIRAKLALGDVVNLISWDGPSVEITAGEGNTGMFTAYTQYLPEARFQNTILLHELMTQPNYSGSSTTFMVRTSEQQAKVRLLHHIRQLVTCAVFDQWQDYLWQAGHDAMLVRPAHAEGIDLLTVTLDMDAWQRLISGGLSEGIIWLPES